MDENVLRFRVGIFVVIAMCILGILIFLQSEGWVPQYTVFLKPPSAPGVKKGTPVRKYGVLIGRVHSVTPNDEDGLVELELRINQEDVIYEFESVSIGSESILGDAGIEFIPPADTADRGQRVPDRFTFNEVKIRPDPFQLIVDLQPQVNETLSVMQQAGRSVEKTSLEIEGLTKTIKSLVDDDEGKLNQMLDSFRQTSDEARDRLDDFESIFANLNTIVADPELQEQVARAIRKVPQLFIDMQHTLKVTRETVRRYGEIPDSIQPTIENVESLTKQIEASAPNVLAQIESSLKKADKLTTELERFSKTLNQIDFNDGTVGKLLNNSDIHDSLLETARNVQTTSAKLEPLMNDLRIFADKIGRNPGSIVKGAIGRGGDTNYKGSAGRDQGLIR